MEPTSIINVLVLTDLLSDGEQLVTIMRRGGLRVYAEAVRDEPGLCERLPGHRWDMLLAHADNSRIPAPRLGRLLRERQPDIFCLTFGSRAQQEALHASLRVQLECPATLPCRQLRVRRPDELTATPHTALFLETLLDELGNLRTRRQLRASEALLVELQARHHQLLAGTSDAVAYLHDGMHVYMNAGYARLFGHENSEALMNTAFLDLLHESQVDQARALLRQEDPQGYHRLLGVDSHGLPCSLNLHFSKVIYRGERCVQLILHAPCDGSRTQPPTPLGQDVSLPPLQPQAPPKGALTTPRPIQQCDSSRQRLHQALERGEAHLMFQPVVGFAGDDLEHYAVHLGREGEVCATPCPHTSPEDQGEGERMDRLILTQCLHVLRELQRPRLRLMVELTAGSLTQPGFIFWLRGQVAESPVQWRGLVLQISEMDIVESPSGQIEECCGQLQALGLTLAVTQFGGSLEPFSHLPAQYASYVELDESLTDGADTDTDRCRRLRDTVSRLAASELKTVARVDRMTLLPALWQAGVDMVRGNCLQASLPRPEYVFVRDEEIMLTALP